MNECIDKYFRFCKCRRYKESTTLPTHTGSKAATGKSEPDFCFGPRRDFQKLEPHWALKYGCLTSFQKSAEYLITLHIHSRMAGWLAVGRTSFSQSTSLEVAVSPLVILCGPVHLTQTSTLAFWVWTPTELEISVGNSRCTRGNQGRISGVPGALKSAACEAGKSGLA